MCGNPKFTSKPPEFLEDLNTYNSIEVVSSPALKNFGPLFCLKESSPVVQWGCRLSDAEGSGRKQQSRQAKYLNLVREGCMSAVYFVVVATRENSCCCDNSLQL